MAAEKKTFTPGGISRYAIRKNMRMNGHPMSARPTMPWFFNLVTADFARREAEQAALRAEGKKLSANGMRPWGEDSKHVRDDEETAEG